MQRHFLPLFFFLFSFVAAHAQQTERLIDNNPNYFYRGDQRPEGITAPADSNYMLVSYYQIAPNGVSQFGTLGTPVWIHRDSLISRGFFDGISGGGGSPFRTFYKELDFGEDYTLDIDTVDYYDQLIFHAKPLASDSTFITFPDIDDTDQYKGKLISIYSDGGELNALTIVDAAGNSVVNQVDCRFAGRYRFADTLRSERNGPVFANYRTDFEDDYTRVCEYVTEFSELNDTTDYTKTPGRIVYFGGNDEFWYVNQNGYWSNHNDKIEQIAGDSAAAAQSRAEDYADGLVFSAGSFSSKDTTVTTDFTVTVANVYTVTSFCDDGADNTIFLPTPVDSLKGNVVEVAHLDTSAAQSRTTTVETDGTSYHIYDNFTGDTLTFFNIYQSGQTVRFTLKEIEGVLRWVAVNLSPFVYGDKELTSVGEIRQGIDGDLYAYDSSVSGERKVQYQYTVDSVQEILSMRLELGDRVKIKRTGAEYLVQTDSIIDLAVDNLFQFRVDGKVVALNTKDGLVNPDYVEITERLSDSLKWKRLFDYAAKTGQGIYIPGGKVYQVRPFSHDFGTSPINITGPENNRSVFTTQEYSSIRFTERIDLTKPVPKSYLSYDTLYFVADVVPVRDSAIHNDWNDIRATVALEDFIMYENGNTSIVTRDQAVAAGFVAELDVDLPEPTEDGLYVVSNPGCTWGGGVAWCDFDFQAGLKVMMGTLVELKDGTWSNVNPSYWLSTESDINIENIIFEDFSISVVLPDKNDDIGNKVMSINNVEARHIQRFCALETAGTSNDNTGEHFFPQRKYEINTVNSDPIVYPFKKYTFEKLTISNSLFDNIFFGVAQGFPMTKDYRVINNICQNSPNVLGFFTSNYMISYVDESNTLIADNKFLNNRHYHPNAQNRRLAGAHGPNAVFKGNIFWQNTGQHMRGNYRNSVFLDNIVDVFNYDTSALSTTTVFLIKITSFPVGGGNSSLVRNNTIKGGLDINVYVYQGESDVYFEDNEINVSINDTRIVTDTSSILDRSLVYIAQTKNRLFSLDPYAHIDTASFDIGDYIYFDYRKQSWKKLVNVPSTSSIFILSTTIEKNSNLFMSGGKYITDNLVNTKNSFNEYEYSSLLNITIDNSYLNFNDFNDVNIGWSNIKNVSISGSEIHSKYIPSDPDNIAPDVDNTAKGNIYFFNNNIYQRGESYFISNKNVNLKQNKFEIDTNYVLEFQIKTDSRQSIVIDNQFLNKGNSKYSVFSVDTVDIVNNTFVHSYSVDTITTTNASFVKLDSAKANISSNKINLVRPYINEVSSSYQEYLDSISINSGVLPAKSEQYRVSYYLNSLDSVSFDLLYNYASTGDSIAKLTNIGAYSGRAVTWGPFVFNSNAIQATDTAYISTGYTPSVDGINLDLESASISIGYNPRKFYTGFNNIHGTFGLSAGSRINLWNRANTTSGTASLSTTLNNYFIQSNSRTNDSIQQVWYNLSLLNETSATAVATTTEVLSYSYNPPSKRYSIDRLSFFAIGSGIPKTYINDFYSSMKGAFYESFYLVEVDSLSSVTLVNNEQSSKIGPDMLIIAAEGETINESAIYESGNRFPDSYFSYNDRWRHLQESKSIDTLQSQNTILRDTTAATAAFTIRIGEENHINTSAGSVTAQVPAGAQIGDVFSVYAGESAGTNSATIDFVTNGYTILGASVSRILNTNFQYETYRYVGDENWIIISKGP